MRVEVVGTRGEISHQYFRAPGRAILAAGAKDWVFEQQSPDLFAPVAPFPLDYFIDVLENRRAPVASIHDARTSFASAMAAYQSAREDRPVFTMEGHGGPRRRT